MIGAIFVATFSGLFFASAFGKISPVIKMMIVITTVFKTVCKVALSTNCANKNAQSVVDKIFTMLFPTRIVVSTLSECSDKYNALRAPFTLFSAIVLILIRFMEERAVSLAEKNAESTNKTAIAAMSAACTVVNEAAKSILG